jgi:glycosyltransferase involved in cell wall biosynthesis
VKHRVLQLIGSYHQGGSERQAVSLARALHSEGGFDIFAATLNDEGVLRAEVEAIGLPPIPVFPLTSFYDLNFMQQVRSCARFMKANEIDLIHTHDFYTNVFGMAAATMARTRVAIASKRETGGMRTSSQDKLERFAFKRADALVANSEAVKNFLAAHSSLAAKIRVIYNGVDVTSFQDPSDPLELRRMHGLPLDPDIPLVTIVANLRHDVKNIPMLLRAAKTVLDTHPGTAFVIAGEGDLQDSLEGLTRELGIADKVHFIGRCQEVPSLLSASYAGVLTSTAEGFSNSLIEYMASGLPVVATDVGGAAEAIVDGETGYLVPSDDSEALAEKLVMLLRDPKRAQELGHQGALRVREKFSTVSQIKETVSLYQEMLA